MTRSRVAAGLHRLGDLPAVVNMELVVGVEDEREQVEQREPVLVDLGADQLNHAPAVLQDAFVDVESVIISNILVTNRNRSKAGTKYRENEKEQWKVLGICSPP